MSWLQKFLKIFFQLLYHQFAWTYDAVAWIVSVGQWQSWVACALPHLSGEHILELGHGPGHFQILANQNRLDITGVDLSPQMGRQCRKRLLRSGFTPKLINASGSALPLPDGRYSTVVATFPTEYILLPETLNEIHRLLVPGGRFVLIPLAWVTPRGPIHQFAAWLFRVTGQSVSPTHPSLEFGRKKMAEAGFQVDTHMQELEHSQVMIVVCRKAQS